MRVSIVICCLLVASLVNGLTVWPKPASITQGSGTYGINPTTFKVTTTSSSVILERAIARYQKLFFPMGNGKSSTASSTLDFLEITVQLEGQPLQFGVDESYTLNVPSGNTNATLQAKTVFGALRGLETFSQLIDWSDSASTYSLNCIPTVISDTPRFPWRGLLVDTARHYLEPSTLYRTIDALSYSKFNTLHWHVVDAESFPIESYTYPNLSAAGAYAPTAVYPQTLVKSIIAYGAERGIRVVPEFDIPGHAYSWGFGYPDLTVVCPDYDSNINNVPLNPSLQSTYDMLGAFLPEMGKLFYDDYFHVGGDEIVTSCWEDNSQVSAWMKQNHYNGVQTIQYFEDQLQPILAGMNKNPIVWEDLFDEGVTVPSNYVIEIWKDQATLDAVVKAGYRAITSYGYYLNEQQPITGDDTSTNEWIDTWKIFYANDPLDGTSFSSQSQVDKVLGGEAAMWAEQVDSVNYDSRVWPRACAVGERLWSPMNVVDQTDATNRLIEHRCRLARRGIGAGPIAPDYCSIPYTPYVQGKDADLDLKNFH